MSSVQYYEISQDEQGQRLDNLLIRLLKGVPKSHIYRLIRGGEVRVNKKRAQASSRVMSGDKVRIPPVRCSEPGNIIINTQLTTCLEQAILFEDKDLLILNKPSGIAVHGGSGLSYGVIEVMRHMRPQIKFLELVHRLDKDTSGCLILAKKRSKLRALQQLLVERKIEKTYWALLSQPWQGDKVQQVNQPLKKYIQQSGERLVVIDPQGKASLTTFKLLENYERSCLVEITPHTGRTHQIRVHSAFLNHPIIGDEKYNLLSPEISLLNKSRLYLHARAIQFTLDNIAYRYQANLDNKFVAALTLLRAGD